MEQRILKTQLRQRGDRTENVPTLLAAAEGGFDTPDADENEPVDAEFLFHGGQRRGPLRRFAQAGRDT